MATDVWKCSRCDTNNEGTADVCRRCGGDAVSATTVDEHERATRAARMPEPMPDFDARPSTGPESRPAGQRSRVRGYSFGLRGDEPDMATPSTAMPKTKSISDHPPVTLSAPPPPRFGPVTPAPSRLSPPLRRAPVVRPAPPPLHRLGKPTAWFLAFVAFMILLSAIAHWTSTTGSNSSSSDGAVSSPLDSGSPTSSSICPPQVAEWLPDGGNGATLVAAYQTSAHFITLCTADTGQVYYDGQVKGAPVDNTNHISLPAEPSGDGYVATNGPYTYQITGGEVIVSENGTVVSTDQLEPAG